MTFGKRTELGLGIRPLMGCQGRKPSESTGRPVNRLCTNSQTGAFSAGGTAAREHRAIRAKIKIASPSPAGDHTGLGTRAGAEKRREKMKTICSWCGRLINDGETQDGLVSHGMREACAADLLPLLEVE